MGENDDHANRNWPFSSGKCLMASLDAGSNRLGRGGLSKNPSEVPAVGRNRFPWVCIRASVELTELTPVVERGLQEWCR